MAFLYKRSRSPFWWVRWVSPNGEKHQESTGYRHGIPAESRKAKEYCARKALQETAHPFAREFAWETWVLTFLAERYAGSPQTYCKTRGVWATLAMYLEEIGVRGPTALRREHCLGYITWRRGNGHMNKKGSAGKQIAHNTALHDLRILSVIMTEAVHRGIIDHSPLWRLGVKKTPPREKQELTQAHIAGIRQEIQRVMASDTELGHFFSVSFEIAMAQGWRLHETYLELDQVNLESFTVYRVQKGGRNIASPLNPSLVPLIERLRAEGRRTTYKQPKLPSLQWFKLFDRLRAKDPSFERVSFHSTRVTVISRLLNAGVGQPSVMKMVGHASATINRLYHRLSAREAAQLFRALDAAEAPVSRFESPGSVGGNRLLG